MTDVTRILSQIAQGDPTAADQLLPLVYAELRQLASVRLSRENPGQTLQPTALVHEAYLRLVAADSEQSWDSRGHFFAAAAEAMRRILVDNARRKQTIKRGGDRQRESYHEASIADSHETINLLDLDEALARLEKQDSLAAELVKLRYFAGFSMDQIAAALDISPRNAYYTWTYARTWLRREISGGESKE